MPIQGPIRTRSTSSATFSAGAAPSVAVTEPPPAGTVAEPLAFVVPLLTVTWRVAPAHAAGRLPTVTLTTIPDERFCNTDRPAFVHLGVAVRAAPSDADDSTTDAARPVTRPPATTAASA